jgi:hypothetical protein
MAERLRARPIERLEPRRLATLTAGALLVDEMVRCGLIDPAVQIDVERCCNLLRALAVNGIEPDEDEALIVAVELMAEIGARDAHV